MIAGDFPLNLKSEMKMVINHTDLFRKEIVTKITLVLVSL